LKILADTSVLVALVSGSDDDSKSYEFLGNLIENAGYGVWISAVSIRAVYEETRGSHLRGVWGHLDGSGGHPLLFNFLLSSIRQIAQRAESGGAEGRGQRAEFKAQG